MGSRAHDALRSFARAHFLLPTLLQTITELIAIRHIEYPTLYLCQYFENISLKRANKDAGRLSESGPSEKPNPVSTISINRTYHDEQVNMGWFPLKPGCRSASATPPDADFRVFLFASLVTMAVVNLPQMKHGNEAADTANPSEHESLPSDHSIRVSRVITSPWV